MVKLELVSIEDFAKRPAAEQDPLLRMGLEEYEPEIGGIDFGGFMAMLNDSTIAEVTDGGNLCGFVVAQESMYDVEGERSFMPVAWYLDKEHRDGKTLLSVFSKLVDSVGEAGFDRIQTTPDFHQLVTDKGERVIHAFQNFLHREVRKRNEGEEGCAMVNPNRPSFIFNMKDYTELHERAALNSVNIAEDLFLVDEDGNEMPLQEYKTSTAPGDTLIVKEELIPPDYNIYDDPLGLFESPSDDPLNDLVIDPDIDMPANKGKIGLPDGKTITQLEGSPQILGPEEVDGVRSELDAMHLDEKLEDIPPKKEDEFLNGLRSTVANLKKRLRLK